MSNRERKELGRTKKNHTFNNIKDAFLCMKHRDGFDIDSHFEDQKLSSLKLFSELSEPLILSKSFLQSTDTSSRESPSLLRSKPVTKTSCTKIPAKTLLPKELIL